LFLLWPRDAVEVGVIRLERGDVLDEVTTVSSGTVKPVRQAKVRSSAIGDVEKVFFQKGDRVKKNDIIIKLKNREQKARLELADANLKAGLASQRQAVLRKDQVDKNWERTRALFDQNAAPRTSLEQLSTEKSVGTEVLDAADANISQLKAGLEIAQSIYDATMVRAPFGGILSSVFIEEGEAASLGMPLFEIMDDSSLKVEAALDEADSLKVTRGMQVVLSTDASPGKIIDAKVSWVSPVVSHDIKGARTVDITIEPSKPDPILRAGLSVDVEIIVARRQGVLYLPTAAIIGRGTTRHVLAVERSVAVKKPVVTGISNWEMTEIVSGISESDRVIFTLNAPNLSEGVRVRVNPALTPARSR